MTPDCGHSHCRFESGFGDIGRIFWMALALVSAFWLMLAIGMLRRSSWRPGAGAEWEREAEPEGRAAARLRPAVANDNPTGGR